MESSRFERTVRTESSEIFAIYGGARRLGRIDLHYGRCEVHGTLRLEVDLTDDELQQVIDQVDEELVQTHDPEREDFLVTVFKFFFSSRRRHTRFDCDWSSDVCSSD